jgi:glucose-6-phosphate isomerase
LVAARGHDDDFHHHHQPFVANCLAQSEVLMKGRGSDAARSKVADKFEDEELERQAKHRVFQVTFINNNCCIPNSTPLRWAKFWRYNTACSLLKAWFGDQFMTNGALS